MNSNLAPVALFVYNRISHTKKTIEALRNNYLASESDLYIFSDGGKNESDWKKIKELRNFLYSITGFNTVRIIEKEQNHGLSASIIAGISSILENNHNIIVLEDDLVTSSGFLQYMNTGLKLFESEERVISIHGYSYPLDIQLPELFFLRGADCWGWATWQRGWRYFEEDGRLLLSKLKENNLVKNFDYDNSGVFLDMLKKQIRGEINSWAIRWYASAYINGKLTLYPGKSLVQNIGLDNSGTHGDNTSRFRIVLANYCPAFGEIEVKENELIRKHLGKFFKKNRGHFLKEILIMIKKKLISILFNK